MSTTSTDQTLSDQSDDKANPEVYLFAVLRDWGISVNNHVHPPVFTSDEGLFLHETIPGAHCKNLFLRTKNKEFILITLLDQDRVDLKSLQKQLGLGPLSFASDADLFSVLQVKPGSVTPFCLVYPSAEKVKVILDQQMLDFEVLNYHPLRNDMTCSISKSDFLEFIRRTGHQPLVLALPKKNPGSEAKVPPHAE